MRFIPQALFFGTNERELRGRCRAAKLRPMNRFRPLLLFGLLTLGALGANALSFGGEERQIFTTPKVARLLPSAQSALGVPIQIASAGTASSLSFSKRMTDSNLEHLPGGFFFQTKIGDPQRVRIQSIVGADGTVLPLHSTGILTINRWQDGGVNPRWPWLRATFEVEVPDVSERDRGIVRSPFRVELTLPTTESAPLDVLINGEKGTRIRFFKIYREKPNSEWRARYRIENRPIAPGAEVKVRDARDMNDRDFFSRRVDEAGEGSMEIIRLSQTEKILGVSGTLVETARAWRDETKFQRLSFQIPVAPVVKKLSFPRDQWPRFDFAGGTVEVEVLRQFQGYLTGEMWLISKTQATNLRTDIPAVRIHTATQPLFWRSDGTPAPHNGQRFTVSGDTSPASKLRLSGELGASKQGIRPFAVELPVVKWVRPQQREGFGGSVIDRRFSTRKQ